MPKLFHYKGFTLEYDQFGSGNSTVLAFHGFNRPLQDMKLFEQVLAEDESIVSIHLFDHGASTWPNHLNITDGISLASFQELMEAFLSSIGVESFSLIGYSLGGKICLSIIEMNAFKIDRVLLLAPDGLYVNPFYQLLIGTKIGRNLFQSVAHNPKWVLNLTDLLRQFRLVDGKLHRFVHVHLGEGNRVEDRMRIYHSWLAFQHFKPNLRKVILVSQKQNANLNLIMGKKDSVIKPKHGKKLLKLGLEKNRLHFLNQGHQLINQKTLEFIKSSGIWKVKEK
jgi:pimeloyl-ACP methyl ester carboxylesterase